MIKRSSQGQANFNPIIDDPLPMRTLHYERGKVGCVMVHGLTGTPWVFQELADFLAGNGISIHAPLLPGHGTKPKDLIGIPWGEWIDSTRREINAFQTSCNEIFLLGLSVGGSIVLMLANEYPVKGVISLSTPVRFGGAWVVLLPYLKLFKRYWKKRHKPVSRAAGYDRYPLSALSEMLAFLSVMENKLPQITCPALIMHSKNDSTVSSVNADLIYDRIASKIKRKVLLEYPCHSVTKGEDAVIIQKEVLSFIRSNSEYFSRTDF